MAFLDILPQSLQLRYVHSSVNFDGHLCFITVWAAIMESEFSRLDITCDGDYIVPRGAGYPSSLGPNQSCTLYGATPGSDIVSGSSYVAAAFDLDVNDIWRRNLLVLIGWFIFFQVTQVVAIEFFQVSFPFSRCCKYLLTCMRIEKL